ncbi:hypothetical protein BJ912DRAFT_1043145 [Pholiota molesta]|nr:hypothetical protein BJ912DRAFT_1043145 [Pholiota molesta]
MDLLNLSYTAKELRSILTAEYTSSIWKKSYTNVMPVYGELPPKCPPCVDIRHYTSVVFGRNCLFCAGPDATIVHSSALTRLCNTCARNELWLTPSNYYISKRFAVTERNISPDISRLCWCSQISNDTLKSGYYFLKREYGRHASAIQECVNEEAQDHYVTVLRANKRENFYASSEDQLDRWCNAVLRQKAEELRLILEERRRSIRMKLEEEGYTNLCGYDIEILPGVKKAAPLTDKEFLESQPDHGFMRLYLPLQIGTLCERRARYRINEDRALVKERLSELADHIPALLTTCRAEFDRFLVGLLLGDEKRITHVDGKDFDRTPLELATTFFKCHRCIEIDPISYPRILMHECLRKRKPTHPDALIDEEPPVESYGVPIVTAQRVWNRMSSCHSPSLREDPKAFTAAALKERDVRLSRAGVGCSRHIMSWNMAILHDISEHPNDISTQGWSLVTAEDDLARAKKFEDKKLRSSRQKLWEHCRYCDRNVRTNLRTFGAEDHLLQAGGCTIGCVSMRRYDLKQDDAQGFYVAYYLIGSSKDHLFSI